MDGTPVNEPGGAFDLSNFTLGNIDKIEIVHGASSALYGSDAMDGVIQIFTHRGTTTTPQIAIEGDGGTFGTGHGAGQLSGLLGKFDYSAATDYFSTDGQGPGDYFRDATSSGNFGWKFSDTDSLRLTLRNTISDAGQPGQTLLPGGADIRTEQRHPRLCGESGLELFHRRTLAASAVGFRIAISARGKLASLWNISHPNTIAPGRSRSPPMIFRNGSFTAGYENEVENGPTAGRHNQAGYLEARYQFGKRLISDCRRARRRPTDFSGRAPCRASELPMPCDSAAVSGALRGCARPTARASRNQRFCRSTAARN